MEEETKTPAVQENTSLELNEMAFSSSIKKEHKRIKEASFDLEEVANEKLCLSETTMGSESGEGSIFKAILFT
jgi:hypothetical protein